MSQNFIALAWLSWKVKPYINGVEVRFKRPLASKAHLQNCPLNRTIRTELILNLNAEASRSQIAEAKFERCYDVKNNCTFPTESQFGLHSGKSVSF